jgi:hypothetical protein
VYLNLAALRIGLSLRIYTVSFPFSVAEMQAEILSLLCSVDKSGPVIVLHLFDGTGLRWCLYTDHSIGMEPNGSVLEEYCRRLGVPLPFQYTMYRLMEQESS